MPRIASDIRTAIGLPASAYVGAESFAHARERIFARSWQWAGDTRSLDRAGDVRPLVLLPDYLDEPLVFVRTDAGLVCRTNVCTHRGNLVVSREERDCLGLRCRYHGRRFGLDGRCLSMPEFQGVAGFPSDADHLASVATDHWGRFSFVRLEGESPFAPIVSDLRRWLGFVDHDALVLDPGRSRDYEVAAHWALYCENYLEGFHIPFVHPALSSAIEWRDYRTELTDHCVVQIGPAGAGGPTVSVGEGYPGGETRLAAIYVFVFPNLMLNAYPWGLSVNVVEPIAVDRTRVRFLTFVSDASHLGGGAGGDVHQVELEDEEVVQSVQRGVRSRFYRRARFSPTQEQGVHWLHRKLDEALGLDDARSVEPSR